MKNKLKLLEKNKIDLIKMEKKLKTLVSCDNYELEIRQEKIKVMYRINEIKANIDQLEKYLIKINFIEKVRNYENSSRKS